MFISAIKSTVKRLLRLLGFNISTVGNALGSIRKNLDNFAKGGKSHIKFVNIGGGPFYKPGWGVLDYTGWSYAFFPGTVDWQHNLASLHPLPLKSGSIELFYSSHCFEHLPDTFHPHLLSEMYRTLKPGGIVRITTPDFDKGFEALKEKNMDFFRGYLCNSDTEATQAFVGYFCAGYLRGRLNDSDVENAAMSKSKEAFIEWIQTDIPEAWLRENQDHVSIWYFDKFEKLMREAGFTDIRRSNPGESQSPEMRGHGFAWAFDHRYPEGSIFVEARKP